MADSSVLLEHAERCVREGNLENAINLCAEVLKRDPKHVLANLQVARAAKALGENAVAEKHFRSAAANSPGEVAPHIELACLMLDTKRLREGERILERASAANPTSVAACC